MASPLHGPPPQLLIAARGEAPAGSVALPLCVPTVLCAGPLPRVVSRPVCRPGAVRPAVAVVRGIVPLGAVGEPSVRCGASVGRCGLDGGSTPTLPLAIRGRGIDALCGGVSPSVGRGAARAGVEVRAGPGLSCMAGPVSGLAAAVVRGFVPLTPGSGLGCELVVR